MGINLLLALGLISADAADDVPMQNGIRWRQWQEIIAKLPAVLGGQLVALGTFLALAHGHVDFKPLAVWVVCSILGIASNLWLYLRYRHLPALAPTSPLANWRANWEVKGPWSPPYVSLCLFLQAVVWGFGLALVLPDNTLLLLQALVLLIAVLSGTPFALSSHFATLASFAAALILPMGLRFMQSADPQLRILGFASVPCLLMFLQAGRLLNRHLIDSYRALEQKQRLVLDLEHEKGVIRDALGQAEAANNAKSRFLAGASHDLRQPLQAIGLTVASLRREPLADKRSVLFENLARSVDRLDRLFNRLLDISRLDAGKVLAVPLWVSSAEVLKALQEQFGATAANRGLDLRFRDGAQCMVQTDPDLLEQLLGNLIANALRYTQQGGVLVAARRHGGQLLFQVWDTGIGIELERHDSIFEEFVQLDNPSHSQARGLGLGLAISRRLSLVLGGTLSVKSRLALGKPGNDDQPLMRGTVFELALNGAASLDPHQLSRAQPTMQLAGESAPNDLAGMCVLLVDDEPDILQGLAANLASSGVYCNCAENLSQTRQWLDATERLPDALIVDYRLARGETAWDIIEATRQACDGQLAVIICTGEINPQLEAQAALWHYPLLTKPVSITVLEAELASALKRLNRQLEAGAGQ